MLKKFRRFLLIHTVTPERVRALVARVISWFLQWATATKAWDAVSLLPKWLRKIADFIDRWNAAELPADKDQLIAELVGSAITDDAVDRLIEDVVALELKECPDGVWRREA